MNKTRAFLTTSVVVFSLALTLLSGCDFATGKWRFIHPAKVIAKPDGRPVVSILEGTGPMDQHEEFPPNATFPTPADQVYDDSDYILGPSDVVNVTILDLYFSGGETVLQKELSEGGYIDLPLLELRVKAAGKTKVQLREDIVTAYVDANILNRNGAVISVEIAMRRQSVVTMIGAIRTPGQYPLGRRDMRLLDVIALAGGVTQSNIKYIYIIRQPRPQALSGLSQKGPAKVNPTGTKTDTPPKNIDDALDELRKGINDALEPKQSVLRLNVTADDSPTADTEPVKDDPANPQAGGKGDKLPPVLDVNPEKLPISKPKEPVASDDRSGGPTRDANDPFGWSQTSYKKNAARVIVVNLRQLERGAQNMNIVIHDHDTINVPNLEVGEFYMYGEINRQGVYSLTGRKMTVKMALAAAGGLGEMAVPENTVLIRRIGASQEQHIPLNLKKIIRGQAPDIYLKPDDVLAIGTSWQAPFFAVFRNAFRMSYGFGFVYDRNLANPLFDVTGKRFTRW